MSYSERMRYIQEEANQYLSRNKVRDASEITLIRQAKASSVTQPQIISAKTNLHTSQIVPPYQGQDSCDRTVIYSGAGTNNDRTAILQKAQSCAVCSDDDPSVNRYVTSQSWPCYDRLSPPFVQNNISSIAAVSCTPGFNSYPRKAPLCASNTNIYFTPSG